MALVLLAVRDHKRMGQVADELARYGHSVEVVSEGPVALQHVRGKPPDVLVVEEHLPPVLGCDLVESARHPGVHEVQIVFLVARGADSRATIYPHADIDEYVYWDGSTSFWQVVLSVLCALERRGAG